MSITVSLPARPSPHVVRLIGVVLFIVLNQQYHGDNHGEMKCTAWHGIANNCSINDGDSRLCDDIPQWYS